MGMMRVPGKSYMYPDAAPELAHANGFITTPLIDATGEKIAFSGRFWTSDYKAKTINTVGFLPGTVVSAGGSKIRVSFQDPSLTLGPPTQPDGTADQYREPLLSALTSNTWYTTGLVTSDGTDAGTKRTVNHGDLISVVIEFDAGGRLGADSLIAQGPSGLSTAGSIHCTNTALYTTSWAGLQAQPNIVFTCSDGSLATLYGTRPYIARTITTYTNGTTPDEYALRLIPPKRIEIDGLWMNTSFSVGADTDLVLYRGTSEIVKVAIDSNTVSLSGNSRLAVLPLAAPLRLEAGVEYYVSNRPTTANGVSQLIYDVANAAYWALDNGPTTACLVTRTNLGAWSAPTLTRRPMLGVMVCGEDDGIPHPRTRPMRSRRI